MAPTPVHNDRERSRPTRRAWDTYVLLVLLFAGIFAVIWLVAVRPASAAPNGGTVIVVDTSADLNPGSNTRTCTYSQGGLFIPATDGCTLRRALREAAGRPQADRPITIQFNLPPGDANANLEVAGTWTLPVNGANALPVLKTDSILNKNGQVTIDGATQPGGRAAGPKIIIATNDRSLEVESTGNVIRNLAFKGGGVIFLKEDSNTVENIWMGLSDSGAAIIFRTPAQPFRMAGGGIHISANSNIVRNNVISGAFARAVNIDGGDNNLIENNRIGTRADGSVPAVPAGIQCARALGLDPANWYGGWGIALSGSNNRILNNRIAGLHIVMSANDTPPIAIEVFGVNQEVTGNIIGVGSNGAEAGVCGQGIKLAGNGSQILNNQIVRSRQGFEDDAESAMLSSDSSPTFGSITVRGNLVKDGPGNIYAFGPGIPEVLRVFRPARITNINGVTVTGTSGDASPCPGCRVDFYLDDNDLIAEALLHLGSVVADGSGNFTFALAQALTAGQGIRTMSTSLQSGVMAGYGAGTTTQASALYTPPVPLSNLAISGPTTGVTGTEYAFNITVTPANVTTPIDYLLTVTDLAPLALNGSDDVALVGSFTWVTPGVKTIQVRAENLSGEMTKSFQITITAPPTASSGKVYIPLVER